MIDGPQDGEGNSIWDRLRRRKVVQWTLAYAAGAWGLLQGLQFVVDAFEWPNRVLKLGTVAALVGLPLVVAIAWFRGERGAQRVTRTELAVVTILFLVGGGLFWHYQRTSTVLDLPVAARPVSPPVAVPAGPPNDRSIAVLPFVNMSADQEQEYFADGISEELLNLLAQVPGLRVIARTSSFSFKGKEADIAEIASKLNVAHVLEGSVRKSGDKLRITAQLIRTADSSHLWSQTYDRQLTDVFAIQDEIAAAVVEQLKVKLLGASPTSRVTDLQAYEKFLLARQLGQQWTAEGLATSSALLREVVAKDPGHVEAWRLLARDSMNMAYVGLRPTAVAYDEARQYIDKALAIDPNYGRGHDGLALVALNSDRDLAAAAREWRLALQLDPGNAIIISNSSGLLDALGRHDQSIAVARYGVSRDPLNPLQYGQLGWSYYFAGRLDESAEAFRTALKLSPGHMEARFGIARTRLLAGDGQGALDEAKQETSEMFRLWGQALAYQALGKQAESDAVLEELIRKYDKNLPLAVASVYARRGDSDQAFEWLEKAVTYRDAWLVWVSVEPLLAGIHDDSRWLPFLRKLGMAPEQLAAIEFDVKLPE